MSENAQNIAFFTRLVGAESAGLSIIIIRWLYSILYIYIMVLIIIYSTTAYTICTLLLQIASEKL